MDPRTVQAAHNNARWCDIVCRINGAITTFYADSWASATRSPPAYPDAVTLRTSAAADRLLARVDSAGGCSVKDSFASLDLSGSGFDVLFEADWIYRPAAAPTTGTGLRWRTVRTAEALAAWAQAHGSGEVLGPELFEEPAAVVLAATDADDALVAGVIGTRTAHVVGLSNLFTVSADLDEVWAGAVDALMATHPGLPLVGYELGEDLAAAVRAGFSRIGGLQVWLAP